MLKFLVLKAGNGKVKSLYGTSKVRIVCQCVGVGEWNELERLTKTEGTKQFIRP